MRSPDLVESLPDVIVRAQTLWAFIDPVTGRPRRMPPEIAAEFLRV
jgi:acyl-CoA thioesterase FadM